MQPLPEAWQQRFFVLSGGDAAGKSTLLQSVAKLRPDWAVGGLDPSTWLPDERLPHLEFFSRVHPREVLHGLTPHARATLLLNLLASHWEYWTRPRLAAGKVVVLDSYYYRFYIKERLRNIVPDFFYAALESLPDAGTVILARVDPAVAFRRRQRFCVHETYSESTEADFIRFQNDVLTGLRGLCQARCNTWLEIDAEQPAESAARDFVASVEAQLEKVSAYDVSSA